MSGSPLIGRIFTGTEKWRSVEQARLVVTADPHGSIGSLHLAEDGVAELVRFGRTGSAPRNGLPTLKSKTTLGAVSKSVSRMGAALFALEASHCCTFSLRGSARKPQA